MRSLSKLQMNLFDWLMPGQPLSPPRQPLASTDQPALPDASHVTRHPQANRQIDVGAVLLQYHLRRSNRKTIGLQVGVEGLCVTAPRWALVADINQVVLDKGPWVLEKMRQLRARDLAHHQQSIQWEDGVCLPYLGRRLRVCLDPQVRCEGLHEEVPQTGDPALLRLRLPLQASSTQIREKTQSWLMKQARAHFTQRLDCFAPRLGVSWSRLRLSQAKTRWGSANMQGVISLNWRLIHHAPSIIDYVVVHELSHLREMNHSPAFWDTVATVMPDYAQYRLALNKDPLPPW
jgi:predicted metal-dependent hydrolase